MLHPRSPLSFLEPDSDFSPTPKEKSLNALTNKRKRNDPRMDCSPDYSDDDMSTDDYLSDFALATDGLVSPESPASPPSCPTPIEIESYDSPRSPSAPGEISINPLSPSQLHFDFLEAPGSSNSSWLPARPEMPIFSAPERSVSAAPWGSFSANLSSSATHEFKRSVSAAPATILSAFAAPKEKSAEPISPPRSVPVAPAPVAVAPVASSASQVGPELKKITFAVPKPRPRSASVASVPVASAALSAPKHPVAKEALAAAPRLFTEKPQPALVVAAPKAVRASVHSQRLFASKISAENASPPRTSARAAFNSPKGPSAKSFFPVKSSAPVAVAVPTPTAPVRVEEKDPNPRPQKRGRNS